jgi:hypothetical protein
LKYEGEVARGSKPVIDKRVIERQIRKGKLDGAAYKRTLESLPDVSDRVARDTDIEPSRPAMSSVASVSAVSSGLEPAAAASESEADDDLDDDDEDDDEDEGDDEDDAEDAGDAPAST